MLPFTSAVVRAGAQSMLFNWTFHCVHSLVQSVLPTKDRAVLNLLLSAPEGVRVRVYRGSASVAGASGLRCCSHHALSSAICRTAVDFQPVFPWCRFQWMNRLTKHLTGVKGTQKRGICCSAGTEEGADRPQVDGALDSSARPAVSRRVPPPSRALCAVSVE